MPEVGSVSRRSHGWYALSNLEDAEADRVVDEIARSALTGTVTCVIGLGLMGNEQSARAVSA